MKKLVVALLTFLVLWGLAAIADRVAPYDDTDSSDGKRSGVALHTDYGTGCQYIRTMGFLGLGSTITPRLLPDGRPFCRESLVRRGPPGRNQPTTQE